MAVPSHRIHTIHGSFGSPSRFGPHASLSMSTAQASWNRIPNVCAPRARAYDLAPAPRTTPASTSAGAGSGSTGLGMRAGLSSASGSRPRRTSVTLSYGAPVSGHHHHHHRRAPPPPPAPTERTASALVPSVSPPPAISMPAPAAETEDPFADAEEDAFTPLAPPPLTRSGSRTRVTVSTYTVPVSSSSGPRTSGQAASSPTVPPGVIPSAKDMRGRLVANVLLSRGSGRPLGVYLRRRLSGEQAGYVKSGLSQLVAAAA